jgi:cholest-4-en-3-one 26-monooxygenase
VAAPSTLLIDPEQIDPEVCSMTDQRTELDDRLANVDIHSIRRYETDGYPWADWDLLRDEDPVHWYEREGIAPFWAITRYEDVKALGADDDSFVNGGPRLRLATRRHDERMWEVKAKRDALYGWDPAEPFDMVYFDDPRHSEFRLLVARGFTPAQCRRMASSLEDLAQRFVSGFESKLAADGRADLVNDLAVGLPLATICEMMGVPVDDWSDIHRWTDSSFDTDSMEWALPGETKAEMRRRLRVEFFQYIDALIERKRAEPGDDLASTLVHAELSAGPLTQQQLHGYLTLLIAAGNETTRNATSRGVIALLEHPDELARLRSDPDRYVETAVEEVVRWTSPVIQFARTATRDVTLHGKTIKAGDTIGLWYPSANRDERQFDDPYHFDVGRDPNYHVGFGHGPHFCLGANLARWELRAIFRALATSDVLDRIVLDGPGEYMTDLHVGTLTHQMVSLGRR